jgi:hypothetical protein
MKLKFKAHTFSIFFISVLLLLMFSCSKKKKGAVVANSSALTSLQKLEAAINARIGVFKITGNVDTNIYTPFDNKTVTVSKLSSSRIRVAADNFPMGIYEFDVQNGTTVSNGVVSGSDDGKAIGYVGTLSGIGNIIFACDESDNMSLVVTGVGINNVSIGGTK